MSQINSGVSAYHFDADVVNQNELHELSQEKTSLILDQLENKSMSMFELLKGGKLASSNQRLMSEKEKKAKELLRVCAKKKAGSDKERYKVDRVQAENMSKTFALQNPELSQETLMRLYEQLSSDSDSEEILELVNQEYPDPYLSHCAMEYLKEVCGENTALEGALDVAIADYQEEHGREIQIGYNTARETQEFADGSNMSPTRLRSWYRDTVNSKRGEMKTPQLVSVMVQTFGYEKMVKAIHFFLRGLGAEIRANNTNFERAELADKVSQIRSLQANLQVFRSSRKHMRILEISLKDYLNKGFGKEMPNEFDFIKLGSCLMVILERRHVSADLIQVQVRSSHPSLQDNLAGVICTVQQMSLMLGDLDPNRVFLSPVHRKEVMDAFKSALTDLYDLAQPELEDYVFEDEPKDVALSKDDSLDESFNEQVKNMDNDPELKEMIEMFEAKGLL